MTYVDWSGNEIEDAEGDSEKRDKRDQEAALLPRSGERHNSSAIPVSDRALAALLSLAQQGMFLANCQAEDCENCNEHRQIWWDCCNALDKSTRIMLQAWLNGGGWGLPEAPWEDIDSDGLPLRCGHVGPRG